MLFQEAKTKMEFGLALLGHKWKQYQLVTEQAWGNDYPDCKTKPHLLDSPGRICGDCRIFYIADNRLEGITDEDLVEALKVLDGFMVHGMIV